MALDQSDAHRFLRDRVELCLRGPEHHGQEGNLRAVAETGELLQGLLGLDRQAAQLADHEVDHVVGVPLGVNASRAPRTSAPAP